MSEKQTTEEQLYLQSEEMQEIFGHTPSWLVRRGIAGMFFVLVLFISMSWFFKYPDKVTSSISLTSENPPTNVVANTNGQIEKINVQNNQKIKEGEVLAVIENITDYRNVLLLKKMLHENNSKMYLGIPELFDSLNRLDLGELQPFYLSFIKRYDYFTNFLKLNFDKKNLDIQIKFIEQKSKFEFDLKEAYDNLNKQVMAWENTYLLKAPISGEVEFNTIIKNQRLKTGDAVFRVVPEGSLHIIGMVNIPVKGASKIRKGQKVNVKFDNYPYMEYGIMIGTVEFISLSQIDNNYSVIVTFPNGLITTYHKELQFTPGMIGTAELITGNVRLFDRITQPLRSVMKN
jgi:hypothetical protein